MNTERQRLLKACLVVAAIFFVVPCLDSAFAVAEIGEDVGGGVVGLGALPLADGDSGIEGFLTRLEAVADAGDPDVSESFEEEIGLPPDARDVRVSGSVVGCVVDGEASEVLASAQSQMEARGWTGVPLGGVAGMTFAKPSGRCTWALVTCEQIGSATSLVVRCA